MARQVLARRGLQAPMLVCREGAERYAEVLGGLGAEGTVQLGPAGEAISRKLLRSGFQNARRRADEMTAATEQLLELEVPAQVATAALHGLVRLRDGGARGTVLGPEASRLPWVRSMRAATTSAGAVPAVQQPVQQRGAHYHGSGRTTADAAPL